MQSHRKEIVFENLISFLYQIAPIKCKWCEIISILFQPSLSFPFQQKASLFSPSIFFLLVKINMFSVGSSKTNVFCPHPENSYKFPVKIVKLGKTRLTSSIRNENIEQNLI